MHTSTEDRPSQPRSATSVSERNACLAALSPAAFSLLKPHLSRTTVPGGTVLWATELNESNTYFPMSGLISVVYSMANGDSVEVANVSREGAAGTIFDSGRSARGVVQFAGSFITIGSHQLLDLAQRNAEIGQLLSACQGWLLAQSQQFAACTALHSAEKRLCRWLYQCIQKMEIDTLYATQEQIAALLGLRRTTVTLVARSLLGEGVIDYGRGRIRVSDLAKLRHAACECCDSLGRESWPAARLIEQQSMILDE